MTHIELRKRIGATGVTQSKIAQILGVKTINLSKYLNGYYKNPPKWEDSLKIVVRGYEKVNVNLVEYFKKQGVCKK